MKKELARWCRLCGASTIVWSTIMLVNTHLSTSAFTKFDVQGHMSTSESQGSDAECVVTLVVRNTDDREFRFEDSSRSLVAATLKVVVEVAAKYFINSGKAYITAFKSESGS